MSYGWISIHRKIQDNEIWLDDEPFDKRSAWIDLILSANHEDREVLLGLEKVYVTRGSKVTSLRKLANKWSWSIGKVKRFLDLLQNEGMITYECNTKRTHYTIVNYTVYQDKDIDKRNTNGTVKEHERNTNETRTETNNNDNNINNIINIVEKVKDEKEDLKKYPYNEIIDYLNSKTNKNYRSTSEANKKYIRARINEGFNLEDFKKVIDNKVISWKNDPKMNQYLRPSTLFGPNFDSYRNEKPNIVKDGDAQSSITNDEKRKFIEQKMKNRTF